MSAALSVLLADGSVGVPSADDLALLTAGTLLLSSCPDFLALVSPLLSRAEVNAGLLSTQPGYLYLRFDVPGSVPQELWLHWGAPERVHWKSGQVSVQRP